MATTVKTNNGRIAVRFFTNGGDKNDIFVNALEMNTDNGRYEYWFTIGEYKTLAGAKRAAAKKMAKFGYTVNAKQLDNLKL